VTAFLGDSSFNNPGQLVGAMTALGLAPAVLELYKDALGPMMARRHWIVHRADGNETAGRGHYAARTVAPATVKTWYAAVQGFGRDVSAALP
jgi:hypothetical protein